MKKINDIENKRFDIAADILKTEDFDFFMIVALNIDRASHAFWKYMDKNHPEYNKKDGKKYGFTRNGIGK